MSDRPQRQILDVAEELKRLGLVLEVAGETMSRMEAGDSETYQRLQYTLHDTREDYTDKVRESAKWEKQAKSFTALFCITLVIAAALGFFLVAL